MAAIEERCGRYRIHFRCHGEPHVLTPVKVSESDARPKSDKFGRF